MLFSVGFGGERTGYAYLARHWAQAGFATAVVEHVGSNLDVLKEIKPKRFSDLEHFVAAKAREPEEMTARPLDLFFVKSKLDDEAPLLLGGHSYGAYTVVVAAGGTAVVGGAKMKFKQALKPRALLLMSPQPPGEVIAAYPQVRTMAMTGTRDNFRVPYTERIKAPHDVLEVIEGADHMTFAGVGLQAHRYLPEICRLTTRFWEDSLQENA